MDRVQAVRLALAELGEASAQEVASFVDARYGIAVDPRFVPVMREMFKQQALRAAFYRERETEAAAPATEAHEATPPVPETNG